MANGIETLFQFLHDNHLVAMLLGTGLGASLSKIFVQIKRIFIKNRCNIFKTADEVTKKISQCLAQDEEETKTSETPSKTEESKQV